jgi:uroporphyrinogen-III decarboxylase
MKFGEKAMRDEFERIIPSCKKGKVIISVDHQTPPDVSLETYYLFVRLFKEYASKVSK